MMFQSGKVLWLFIFRLIYVVEFGSAIAVAVLIA
jgi:hypothetical protein